MATIHQLARPARSRIACAMMCAHDAYFLASLAAPQPDLRPRSLARSACSPYGSGAKSGAAPDTRGLLVVSISVRPRYSSAGLVKWYPIDDIIRVFDETFILRSSFFPLAPLLYWYVVACSLIYKWVRKVKWFIDRIRTRNDFAYTWCIW